MLALKKISRVFDPTGTNPENLIPGESHTFTDLRSKYFALHHGSFYTDSLVIRELATNKILVKGIDYNTLHLYLEPTSLTGKSVTCMVHILKEGIDEIVCSYQAVGGKYQNLLFIIDMIKKLFPDGNVIPINWNNISDLPAEFIPTAHMHDVYEFNDWTPLVKSLYNIYTAIINKKTRKFKDIFDYLVEQRTSLDTRLINKLSTSTDIVEIMLTRTMIQSKEWLITDNVTNPANYLQYGNWSVAGKGMMLGETDEDEIGNTIDVKGSVSPDQYVARKTYFWRLNTDESGYGIQLTRDHATVAEGGSSRIRLITTGMPGNKVFNYKITGIQSSDINQPLSGSLTTNASGVADFNFTVISDGLTEGTETLRFAILDWYTNISVNISDTSTSTIYDLGFYNNNAGTGDEITLVDEGEKVYLVCKASSSVPTGTILHLHYVFKNGMSADDFEGTLPTTMTVNSGKIASTLLTVKKDYLTEGMEAFGVSISLDNSVDNNIVTKWIKINDTSKTPVYYMFFSSNSSGDSTLDTCNEGDEIFLIVESSNTPNGTTFDLVYGNSTESADFVGTRPNSITINNNRAFVKLVVKADLITEGLETLHVNLMRSGSSIATASIHIYDTSVGADGNIGFSTSPSSMPSVNLTKIGEGKVLYLIFNMTNTITAIYNLVYEGSVNSQDFKSVRPNTVTITEGRAVVRYEISDDAAEEGEELFIVRVLEPGTNKQIASAQIIIEDTSVAPTYTIRFTDSEFSTAELTTVNEGELLYVVFNVTNISDGEYLYLDWTIGNRAATTANGDININPVTYVQVYAGKAVATVSLRADIMTEGDEYLKVDVRRSTDVNDPVIATRTILVKDTSRKPTYAVRFNSMATGNGTNLTGQSVLEGLSVYAIITTTNVPDGTSLWLNYVSDSIAVCTQEDFSNIIPSQVTINNNRAVVPFHSIADWDRDHAVVTDEELKINVYSNNQMTIKVADALVKFTDPTLTVRCSLNSNGSGTISQINEGQTFYAIVESINALDGSELPLSVTYNDMELTIENNYLTENIPPKFVLNDNLAIIPIKLKRPNPATGDINITVRVKHPGDGKVVNLSQAVIKVNKVS